MISHFRKDLSMQKALFIVKIKWYDVREGALPIVKHYPCKNIITIVIIVI